ncbi:DUF2783 domain-containing protein [Roseibium algae]|uniref:DUF2783 domain-containing protein n=1 Tax=Roseibium algae TaxID=3123038 RepID=A0ABU8TH87_9HYPH
MTESSKTKGLDRPDDFYAELLAAHEGLSKEESDAFNARLILVLANEIGDHKRLVEALAIVRLNDEMKG